LYRASRELARHSVKKIQSSATFFPPEHIYVPREKTNHGRSGGRAKFGQNGTCAGEGGRGLSLGKKGHVVNHTGARWTQ
jgi:hypothetical protein